MEPLKISCKCITNARVDTLEEAIHSFLIQEYDGERELVIVNDCKFQFLKFDHPNVKIFNIKNPFKTLGDKDNYAVSKCKYPIIAVWDDDDIALSNHLENINEWMGDGDLLHWQRGALVNNNKISKITSLGNSGIVYTKKIWERVGHHERMSYGYDTSFVNKIRKCGGKIIKASPEKISWFYMWGGRSFHLSGVQKNKQGVLKTYREHTSKLMEDRKIPSGVVELQPKWAIDYIKLL